MPDRLDSELIALGRGLHEPPVPDLAPNVVARLREPAPARRRPAVAPRRTLALALLAVLLLGGTVIAAVPAVRNAILDVFSLRGATVERRERAPEAEIERRLDLGDRVTPAGARARVDFAVATPAALGPPDRVYVRPGVPGGQVSLTYRPGPGLPRTATTGVGLLVTEFRGDILPEYARKIAPAATTIERVRTRAGRGLWVAGAPHVFFFSDAGGQFRENPLRLAANVLLVERGRVLVRLEGELSKRRAIAIADSLEGTEP